MIDNIFQIWFFITILYILPLYNIVINKANLRDLIAATGQVISNWIQIVNFSTRVTVKFDGWPRKTTGHFFYTTSSFVHHFKSIDKFKLDLLLQALCSISYPLVNSNWSYSPETPNLGQIQRFLEPCDLEIWQMTLRNNRAPLLCYFKLCASFHTH